MVFWGVSRFCCSMLCPSMNWFWQKWKITMPNAMEMPLVNNLVPWTGAQTKTVNFNTFQWKVEILSTSKKLLWFHHADQVRQKGIENPKMYSQFISFRYFDIFFLLSIILQFNLPLIFTPKLFGFGFSIFGITWKFVVSPNKMFERSFSSSQQISSHILQCDSFHPS